MVDWDAEPSGFSRVTGFYWRRRCLATSIVLMYALMNLLNQ
jgi:hypothetical protein